ncbi:hypothetical protein CC2G_006762 [Coprinopsis cinerea AmutBmut pab1-1]|nr:hypothetical protein CC2G_006762 [Coprinopsis cinerea AmutBmut pab1-1]
MAKRRTKKPSAQRKQMASRRPNNTAVAATLSLEIMATIFAFALPVMDAQGRATFLAIRQVCHAWRTACFRIHDLWTSLTIETFKVDNNGRRSSVLHLNKFADKIVAWFSRAGNSRLLSLRINAVPLSPFEEGDSAFVRYGDSGCLCGLRQSYDRNYFPPRKDSFAGIEAAINTYASRIESLEFNVCSITFFGMMRHLPLDKFTNLRSFKGLPYRDPSMKIYKDGTRGKNQQRQLELAIDNLRNATSIRELVVPSFEPWITEGRFAMSSLTELDVLEGLALSPEHVALVNSMESLRTLKITLHRLVSPRPQGAGQQPSGTIQLERITTLYLRSSLRTLGEWLRVPHIKCPTLTSLHLHITAHLCEFTISDDPERDMNVYEALTEYIRNMDSSQLKALTLSGRGSYGVSQLLRESGGILEGIASVSLEETPEDDDELVIPDTDYLQPGLPDVVQSPPGESEGESEPVGFGQASIDFPLNWEWPLDPLTIFLDEETD